MAQVKQKNLGEHARARRKYLGYQSVKALATKSGVSDRLISDLETGRRSNFSPSTQATLENHYGWKRGSIQDTLSGGAPTVLSDPFAGEPEAQEPTPRNDLDSEFAAMKAIEAATEELDPAARVRVLRWALDRCNQDAAGDDPGSRTLA